MQELLTARIPVWEPGYFWASPPNAGNRLRRVANDLPSAERDAWDVHGREYDPFESAPALLWEFSELQPTEEAVLEFADQYGTLHGEQEFDSLAEWQRESEGMREALRLWQAIEQKNKKDLARYVEWSGRKTFNWIGPMMGFVATRRPYSQWRQAKPAEYRPGDLLGPATALLDHVLTRCVCQEVRLVPFRYSADALSFRLGVNELLDALWLQVASAVAGRKKYERCRNCGKQFELAPGVNRVDRLTCSTSCRVTVHRRRKAAARKLRAQGLSLRQIAAEVGSDMKTVKKWVSKEEEQK